MDPGRPNRLFDDRQTYANAMRLPENDLELLRQLRLIGCRSSSGLHVPQLGGGLHVPVSSYCRSGVSDRGAIALSRFLSEPAALARLREFFGDPLMIVVGKRMMPTAFAEELRPLVRQLLLDAELLVGTSAAFDAATSQRRFRIGASDYIVTVLLTPLLRHLREVVATTHTA